MRENLGERLTFLTNVKRADYIENLKNIDFYLMWTEYEGTGIALFEAIFSGAVPVIREKPWNKGRFPDYPLIAQSDKDFDLLVHLCARNPKKVKDQVKTWLEGYRERFSLENIGHFWSDVLEECYVRQGDRFRASGAVARLDVVFGEVMKENAGKEVTLPVFYDMACKKALKEEFMSAFLKSNRISIERALFATGCLVRKDESIFIKE